MSKHTPMPWQIIETEEGKFMIYDKEQELICSVKKQANARLIAAAPELLEACKKTYEVLEAGSLGQDKPYIKMLEQAIAKAGGNIGGIDDVLA